MNNITFNRNDILKALKANQAAFTDRKALALAARREYIRDTLESTLARMDEDPTYQPHERFTFPQIVDDSKHYQLTIEMLELCPMTTVDLCSTTYQHWVNDEWEWMREFKASAAHYINLDQSNG